MTSEERLSDIKTWISEGQRLAPSDGPFLLAEIAKRDADLSSLRIDWMKAVGQMLDALKTNALLKETTETAVSKCERFAAEIIGERDARQKCEIALRQKDAAMGVLWDRLNKAGVDCSDLIP